MLKPIAGLHHVTAIASDPQRNLDFYTEVLGLRFVKRTVNFDDPGSYHFYFGDDAGSPGTILTFFTWPGASRGSFGTGETGATAFSVPSGSLDFWERHLLAAGVPTERLGLRFGDNVLAFADPDGMRLELVGHAVPGAALPSRFSQIPSNHAIRGFFGVTLAETGLDATANTLGVMGFRQTAHEGNRFRFRADGDAPGNGIDLLIDRSAKGGRLGAGSVHHIAFRAPDDDAQLAWRETLEAESLGVTPVQDRTYFQSIYFRERGGVLFEIATDTPGFAFDEPLETLGETLKLPPWLEAKRSLIAARLPAIELHHAGPVAP